MAALRARARPPRRDVLAAGLLLLLSELALLLPADEGEVSAAWRLTAVGVCLPLAWRRVAPLAAAAGLAAATVLEAVLVAPSEGPWVLLGALIVVFSLFAHAPLRVALLGLVLVAAGMLTADRIASGSWIDDVDFLAVLLGAAGVTGRSAFRRRQQLEAQEALAARLQSEQDALAAIAVADERTRIARDLHDVVAHHVSVMVVQAAAAEAQAEQPTAVVAAARAVQQTGREALAELRRVLDVLNPHECDPVDDSPGIASVQRLVERARAGGAQVEIDVDLHGRTLGAGVDLVVYRVLQEGVTNALRHAPGAPVRLAVVLEGSGVVVSCLTGPAPAATAPVPSAGRGLNGLQDRVALYGGSSSAGPTDDGGFLVQARLPMKRSSTDPVGTPL